MYLRHPESWPVARAGLFSQMGHLAVQGLISIYYRFRAKGRPIWEIKFGMTVFTSFFLLICTNKY